MVVVDDNGDELVEISSSRVVGKSTATDGGIRFALVGGPWHGQMIRVYDPFERVVFKTEMGIVHVYQVHPPMSAKAKWTYVYNPMDKTEYTQAERRPDGKLGPFTDNLDEQWKVVFAFAAWYKAKKLEELGAKHSS